MDKKEKILRKFNFKDYTNRLEKILEKKNFSMQAKNLLLSMFYKIENAYQDYQKTKVEVFDKGEFLENLIKIIQDNCNDIEVIKFNLEQEHILKQENINYYINQEQKKITALGNELIVLNALLEIKEKKLCLPQEENLLEKPISYLLNAGNKMHEAEVIRDFNGWSWDIITKEISHIQINLVFQNMLYLLEHSFIIEWINNNSKLADYLMLSFEKLKQNYGEKRAKSIMELICKFSIEVLAKQDKEQAEIWLKLKKENNQELEKLNNKVAYLENVTKMKKKITKQIEKIDKMLNNKELLQKEYEQRNEKLPNKEKIFSIRHLIKRIEEERQQYVEQIKSYNKLIDPKGYVERKEQIRKNVEFLNILDIEQQEESQITLIKLCLLFLECFEIKIAKAQTRQELTSYFYILRYYRFLTFDEQGTKLKDIEELQEAFENVMNSLVEKTKKENIIEEVTDEQSVNYRIIRNVFDSKIIDLNHLVMETKVEEGKLFVEYYDTNILENTCEVHSDKTIKLKKKTKLFL